MNNFRSRNVRQTGYSLKKIGKERKEEGVTKPVFYLIFPKISHQIYINIKLEPPIRYFMSFSYRYLITKRC